MTRQRVVAALLIAGSSLICQRGLNAQAGARTQSLRSVVETLKALAPDADLKKLFKDAASDPEILNSALDAWLGGTSPGRILQNLNVRFATFEAADTARRGLGLSYSLSQSLKQQFFDTAAAMARGLDVRLSASGNVAFDRTLNPRDFLNSSAALAFFLSTGGAVSTDNATRFQLDSIVQALALIPASRQEELDESPLLAKYMRIVMEHMTTQTHWDVALDLGLESDQSFQQKQYVYGARVGLDIKPWNASSPLAQWNLFDFPFALIRWLNGTDRRFSPRGSAFPTLLFGIAQVDPVANDGREAVGVTGTFTRATLEAAMATDFVRTPTGPLTVQMDVRWYRELGAPSAVRQARLNRFSYFTAALVSDKGPFVSYSRGRLPIDLEKNETYELGFKMNF